jgi:hypothetical protein
MILSSLSPSPDNGNGGTSGTPSTQQQSAQPQAQNFSGSTSDGAGSDNAPNPTEVYDGPDPSTVPGLVFDEEENRYVFLKAKDQTTGEQSVYLSREQAQQGLQRQLEYIGKLKQEKQKVEEEFTQKLSESEAQLQLYSKVMTPQQAKLSLIQEELPEEYRGIDVMTLTDEEQIRKVKIAQIEAEAKVEAKLRSYKEQVLTQKQAREQSKQKALEHVNSRVSDTTFFGLRNVEDKYALEQVLNSPQDNGMTFRNVATVIAETVGTSYADDFLRGVAQRIGADQAQREVQQTLSGIRTEPKYTPSPPARKPPVQGMSAKSMITTGLKSR